MGLIRLFLAFVVMSHHLGVLYLPGLGANLNFWIAYWSLGLNAGYAVMYFYVISGFLISIRRRASLSRTAECIAAQTNAVGENKERALASAPQVVGSILGEHFSAAVQLACGRGLGSVISGLGYGAGR